MARLGQFRRDTYENWMAENPILADGEFFLVAMDSSKPREYTKYGCGDGTSTFSELKTYLFQEGGGGGGTTNYNNLDNKPSINGVTLSGNKTSEDLKLTASVSQATETVLGGIKAATKTNNETVEAKIDSVTGKLFVPAGGLTQAQKEKLDSIEQGANKTVVEQSVTTSTSNVPSSSAVNIVKSELNQNIQSNTTNILTLQSKVSALSGINSPFVGYVDSASNLISQTSPAWALVGDLSAAKPYAYYVSGNVPNGFTEGWNDLSTILGTYNFTDMLYMSKQSAYIRNTGYFYNIQTEQLVANEVYFYSEVNIPTGSKQVEMRFIKSTGGGLGVLFRDADGTKTGSFANMNEADGTKIAVDIPQNSTKLIFSYLVDNSAIANSIPIFDGVTFKEPLQDNVFKMSDEIMWKNYTTVMVGGYHISYNMADTDAVQAIITFDQNFQFIVKTTGGVSLYKQFTEDTQYVISNNNYLYFDFITKEFVVTTNNAPLQGSYVLVAQHWRGRIIAGCILTASLSDKVIRLVGMGKDSNAVPITKVGDIFYNNDTKKLRRVITYPTVSLETVPFIDGAIYSIDDKLYFYDGVELSPFKTDGLFDIPSTSINLIQNQQYDILQDKVISANSMQYCKQSIPNGAKAVSCVFAKSTGGATGMTFKDSSDITISSFINMSVPSGTVISVSIPENAKSFYYSYYTDSEATNQGIAKFTGFKFEDETNKRLSDLENKVDNISSSSSPLEIPVVGSPSLHLTADTGDINQDNITIQQLYEEYDALVTAYPKWFKKLPNLGVDSSGLEIRQYELRFVDPWVVVGEGAITSKTNSWDDATYNYETILINTGTHGDEKGPCWSTMLALKEILSSNEGWALYIKSSFILKVLPCLNPWGFNNRVRNNYNDKDINRDIQTQTQPESIAWKTWIDANKDNVKAYIDMHGVDFFYPFFECAASTPADRKVLYSQMAAQFAGAFYDNWNSYLGKKDYPRPYSVISTYNGLTIDYTESLNIQGFIVETPVDITGNRLAPAPNYMQSYSKSNKIAMDMLINLLGYFGKK